MEREQPKSKPSSKAPPTGSGSTASDGVEFGDFAVLCRVNSDAVYIAQVLKEQGIPAQTSAAGANAASLSSEPETQEIMAYLTLSVDPTHKTAFAAAVSASERDERVSSHGDIL